MKKVILTSILAFFVSLVIFIGLIFAWFSFFADDQITQPSNIISEDGGTKGIFGDKLSIPRKTNFLLIGLDQTELLSDVIVVGCFDSKTGDVTLISIPRDTYVDMSSELRAEIKADGIYMPSQLKINAIHSYAGQKKGAYYLERYLEEMMGIEIDFYAEVNTRAFRDIVDAVGGIDMEIRPQGYYYTDPTQNLVISVPGGMQHLDGAMAEGVVRYRHDYVQGDIDRIDIQQQFMKEFFSQVLRKDVLSENALSILKTCIEYTTTDFAISDLPKYVPYIPKLSAESLTMMTAPGEARMINGASYYLIDNEKMQRIVNMVFYGNGLPKVDENLAGMSIQILNGSDVSMLATQKKAEMQDVGYTVKSVGDSKDEKQRETIIYSKEGVDTSALDIFFTSVKHEVDDTITENYDIVIVLGTLEQ